MEFALLVILLMWASHSKVSLRQTPRYGADEKFASVSSLSMYSNSRFFYFGLDTLKTEHFEGLKHILHRSAQSCKAGISATAPDLLDILSGDTVGRHLQRDKLVRGPRKGGQ